VLQPSTSSSTTPLRRPVSDVFPTTFCGPSCLYLSRNRHLGVLDFAELIASRRPGLRHCLLEHLLPTQIRCPSCRVLSANGHVVVLDDAATVDLVFDIAPRRPVADNILRTVVPLFVGEPSARRPGLCCTQLQPSTWSSTLTLRRPVPDADSMPFVLVLVGPWSDTGSERCCSRRPRFRHRHSTTCF